MTIFRGSGSAGYGAVADTPASNVSVADAAGILTATNVEDALAEIRTTAIASNSSSQALSNKTINLANNTISGTKAEFDTACTDGNFAYQSDLPAKEDVSNKATSFATVNHTLYPSVQATKTYADGLVVGLLDDRGNYDASGNVFPSSGGSGTAGAILKGDLWNISVAGTLGGVPIFVGDMVRSLVDTPGQTAANWSVLAASNLGAAIHASTGKTTPVDADEVIISDSAGSFLAKRVTFANFKTAAGIVAATETNSGIVELATSAEVQTGTDTGRVPSVSSLRGGLLVSGTATATTSGTSHDFTGIPSWVKKITVMLSGVSTNGTSVPLIQIGDSGGIENTGYLGSSTTATGTVATANYTTGFGIGQAHAATDTDHGTITLTLLNASTNTWTASGVIGLSDVAAMKYTAGSKSLSATLDRVRLTTVNGTDAFDAGSINIIYE